MFLTFHSIYIKTKVVFPAFIWSLSSQLIIFIFSQDALTCYKYIWLKLKLSKIYKVMTLTWFVGLSWRKVLLKSCNSFQDEVFYLFSLLICWTMICFLYFMELEDEFVWTTIRRWLPSLGQILIIKLKTKGSIFSGVNFY